MPSHEESAQGSGTTGLQPGASDRVHDAPDLVALADPDDVAEVVDGHGEVIDMVADPRRESSIGASSEDRLGEIPRCLPCDPQGHLIGPDQALLTLDVGEQIDEALRVRLEAPQRAVREGVASRLDRRVDDQENALVVPLGPSGPWLGGERSFGPPGHGEGVLGQKGRGGREGGRGQMEQQRSRRH